MRLNLRYRPEVISIPPSAGPPVFLGTLLRQAQDGELCRTVALYPLDFARGLSPAVGGIERLTPS